MKSTNKRNPADYKQDVNLLSSYRNIQSNEKIAIMAIKTLVQKLKHHQNMLDSLKQVLKTNGSVPTKCVTIPRTKNGMVQTDKVRNFPHVLYVRIWRWLDVQRKDLMHKKCCVFGFELNCDFVCVNPYHYYRIGSPEIDLPCVEVSSSINDDLSKSSMDSDFFKFDPIEEKQLPLTDLPFRSVNDDLSRTSMDVDSDVHKLQPIEVQQQQLQFKDLPCVEVSSSTVCDDLLRRPIEEQQPQITGFSEVPSGTVNDLTSSSIVVDSAPTDTVSIDESESAPIEPLKDGSIKRVPQKITIIHNRDGISKINGLRENQFLSQKADGSYQVLMRRDKDIKKKELKGLCDRINSTILNYQVQQQKTIKLMQSYIIETIDGLKLYITGLAGQNFTKKQINVVKLRLIDQWRRAQNNDSRNIPMRLYLVVPLSREN